MPEMNVNMIAIIVGFVLVATVLVKLDQVLVLPGWLTPFRGSGLLSVLVALLPLIQKGESQAISLGYVLVSVLLFNLCLLVVLGGVSKTVTALRHWTTRAWNTAHATA